MHLFIKKMLSSGLCCCISPKPSLKFIVANQNMNSLLYFFPLYPYLLRGHINCHLNAQF